LQPCPETRRVWLRKEGEAASAAFVYQDLEAHVENPDGTTTGEGGSTGGGRRDPVKDLQARLEAAIDEVRPKIRKVLDDLDARMEEAAKDIKPRAQNAMNDVRPKVDQFVADVQPKLDSLLERLQTKIDELRKDLEARGTRPVKEPVGALPAVGTPDTPAGGMSSGPPDYTMPGGGGDPGTIP
jgi:hypothetical protein